MTTHWPRAFHPDCTTQGHLMTHHPEMGVVCVRCGVRRDGPTPAWPEKADNPFKKRTPSNWDMAMYVAAGVCRLVLGAICVITAYQNQGDYVHCVLLLAAGLLLLKTEKPVVHSS